MCEKEVAIAVQGVKQIVRSKFETELELVGDNVLVLSELVLNENDGEVIEELINNIGTILNYWFFDERVSKFTYDVHFGVEAPFEIEII